MDYLTWTAKQIAEAQNKSQRSIEKRAAKEKWLYTEEVGIGRGGKLRKYAIAHLPADVQSAILIYISSSERDENIVRGRIFNLFPVLKPSACETAMGILTPKQPLDFFPSFSAVMEEKMGKKAGSGLAALPGTDSPKLLTDGDAGGEAQAHLPATVDAGLPVRCTQTGLPVPGTQAGAGSYFPIRYEWEKLPPHSPELAIRMDTVNNKRIGRIFRMIREIENMPRDWDRGTDAWYSFVAAKHGVSRASVYRWMARYNKRGLAGLEHVKERAAESKAWTPEALGFWQGLFLKPEHSKVNLTTLYEDVLTIEAERRGWKIGGIRSALWWARKKATPAMRAYQKGGMKALDNILPPVLRKYNDLAPMEMLVGDQHRFDFWVMDDETGRVFRPECFLWQDLRTRLIYGMAFDYHYDAHLCGLALRFGMWVWGCFNAIYTDNGRPELSRYIMGILSSIRELSMDWKQTEDEAVMDCLDVDAEEVNPVIEPGTHKKAIVKNAKAKMIEGTFCIFEDILRSHFRVAGSVKRLTDDIHTQDVDQEEAKKLALSGKLLLASEFYLTCYRAVDWYNRQKPHRGVKKEWAWKPVPAEVTPMDCLKACYNEGWRPQRISNDAADLVFLKQASRVVNRGRISVAGDVYEHDRLIDMHGQRVDIRYNPIESDLVMVFQKKDFLCAARPVEYSSMKNEDLTSSKIALKRERRRAIAEKFREITRQVPDFRLYSTVPAAEKVAALIGEEKKQIAMEKAEASREISQEELDEKVKIIEELNRQPAKTVKALAGPRPAYFLSDAKRHDWCINAFVDGTISEEDRSWMHTYEAKMDEGDRKRWEFAREFRAQENGG